MSFRSLVLLLAVLCSFAAQAQTQPEPQQEQPKSLNFKSKAFSQKLREEQGAKAGAVAKEAQKASQGGVSDGGGGGYVVKMKGKYILLDLLEFGSEDPFNPSTQLNPKIKKAIDISLYQFSEDVRREVANKLTRIHAQDPYLAFYILKSIEVYKWKLVNASVVQLNDIGESSIDISELEIYQAAIRKSDEITFNRNIVAAMEALQVSALVYHEVFYAMSNPVPEYDFTTNKYTISDQLNIAARKMTGAIFASVVELKGYRQFMAENMHRTKKSAYTIDYLFRFDRDEAFLDSIDQLVGFSMYELKPNLRRGFKYGEKDPIPNIGEFCKLAFLKPDPNNVPPHSFFIMVYQLVPTFITSYVAAVNFDQQRRGSLVLANYERGGAFYSLFQMSWSEASYLSFRPHNPETCVTYFQSLKPGPQDPIDYFY